jgi:hypothetical protein
MGGVSADSAVAVNDRNTAENLALAVDNSRALLFAANCALSIFPGPHKAAHALCA